jgi:quercetin dioxygenase-like cupin family protein
LSHYRVPDMDPLSPAEGVEVRAVHGERMTMAFFRAEAGSRVPEHAHHHEQIGTVIRGKMEMALGDERFTLTSGLEKGVLELGYAFFLGNSLES